MEWYAPAVPIAKAAPRLNPAPVRHRKKRSDENRIIRGKKRRILQYGIRRFTLKNRLYKEHVQEGSRTDAEQRIFLPIMKQNNGQNGDPFWKPSTRTLKGDISQTINHQQSNSRIRQYLPQIGDVWMVGTSFTKEDKGQKTGDLSPENGHEKDSKGLKGGQGHDRSSFPWVWFLYKNRIPLKAARMATMAGMMKCSAPKISKVAKEHPSPTNAGL